MNPGQMPDTPDKHRTKTGRFPNKTEWDFLFSRYNSCQQLKKKTMSTAAQLSENSHQGFDVLKAAFCLAEMEAKSNNASEMPVCLRRNGIGSRSSSKERDAETGLDYFGARYYSAAQGRFLSVDPGNAGASNDDPQSWNAYAYARNNPLKYIDPNGERYSICNQSNYCFEMSDQSFISTFWLRPGIEKGKGSTIGMGTIFWKDEWWDFEQMYVDPEEEPIHDASFELATLFIGGGKAAKAAGAILKPAGKAVAEEAVGNIIANGSKEAIRRALDKGVVESAQKAAIKSALSRGAATSQYTLEKLADGSVRIITKRAGRDGYQAIERLIDSSGATKSIVQKAYSAAGKLVHEHPKYP